MDYPGMYVDGEGVVNAKRAIRESLAKAGYSMQEMADKTGYPPSYLENGQVSIEALQVYTGLSYAQIYELGHD